MMWKTWCVTAAMALGVVACGGSPGANNKAACEAFVQNVKCGTVDISAQVPCTSYENTTCDISAYFDCLSAAYVCVNGMYDPAKLATASACQSQAVCK